MTDDTVTALIDAILESFPEPTLVTQATGRLLAGNRAARQAVPGLMTGQDLPWRPDPDEPEVLVAGQARFKAILQPLPGGCRLVKLQSLSTPDATVALRVRFFSVAAHDLRGVLANIRSYAGMVLSGRMTLDDRAKRAVEVIARNADKALGLTSEFFDSLRQELEPMPLDVQTQAVMPLIDAELVRLRPALEERHARLDLELPDAIPPAPVDGPRFQHMVRALLEHGLARSADGGTLTLQLRTESDLLELSVPDHGPIPGPEQLAHAFDRDHRAAEHRKLDAGFRLSVARLEAEAHGGEAFAQALPDGARFGFRLPMRGPPHLVAGAH